MSDFEAAPQEKLSVGKRLEASRATQLLSNSRLIGESASLVAGMAICIDFAEKMGDFERPPQER